MTNLLIATAIAVFTSTIGHAQGGYLTYPAGGNPNGVIAADLDGDGKSDLIVANSNSNSLTILLDNHGTFTAGTTVIFSGATANLAPRTLVAADLNRDHKIDLVVAGYKGLAVILGNGDGTFQTPQLVNSTVADVSVADLDQDGVPDIAFTYLTGGFLVPTGAGLSILKGNGDGTFQQGPFYFLGLTPWAVPGIGDFNGDGKPDIAVPVGQSLIVFLNDGTANFQAHVSSHAWNFAPGIATADFDGDGLTDLAVSGQSVPQNLAGAGQGQLTILLGNGDGTFRSLSSIVTATVAQTLVATDLNGDHHPDLVAGLNPPAFFAGHGDGTFVAGIPIGGAGNSGYVTIGNFAGIGATGVAGTNGGGNVVVLPQVLWPSAAVQNLSAAAFSLGPLAPGSIAAIFGSGLATKTSSVTDASLPASLGGDSVIVTASDGSALPAQLYYVSGTQVNYVIPPGAAPGLGSVTVKSDGNVVATAPLDIETIAPQLFTLNSANLVAANVIRVNSSLQQTFQPVFQLDSSGNAIPLPVDLSSSTDSVYLSVFGTGIRNLSAPGAVTATFNGTGAQVVFAGPQGTYPGLDQVNILLPKVLTSTTPYLTTLQLTVDGQPSNPVRIAVE